MQDLEEIDRLALRMFAFNRGDAKRIQHLVKVHRFAQLIGRMEKLDDHTQWLVECAALVHDIGIRPAEEKYGSCDGRLQEKEGPAYARALLTELGFDGADVERICYLVGHHHTYTHIDGIDYQILVEADFLVNLYEDEAGPDAVHAALERVFRTQAGRRLCCTLYEADPCPPAGSARL